MACPPEVASGRWQGERRAHLARGGPLRMPQVGRGHQGGSVGPHETGENRDMNLWLAKATIIAAAVAMVAIRAPHGSLSYKHKVARSWKDRQEAIVLTIAWIGFLIP